MYFAKLMTKPAAFLLHVCMAHAARCMCGVHLADCTPGREQQRTYTLLGILPACSTR